MAITAEVYPAEGIDVVLRDGSTVHVRPIRPSDEAAVLRLLRSLSDSSRELRFFSRATDLEGEASRAATVDGRWASASWP